jgi:hypothetical protein
MGSYVTTEEARAAIDPNALLALFADRGEGAIADANPNFALALSRAHTRVKSNAATIYDSPAAELPADVPGLLKDAELSFFIYFAYSRKPAYALKTLGPNGLKDLWKQAESTMDRLKDAIEAIPADDHPPAPSPENVGGITVACGPIVTLNGTGDF